MIQFSHVTDEQILSIPGLDDVFFMYERETFEWVPVFNHVKGDIKTIVDMEPWKVGPYDDEEQVKDALWVTPKGFPRQQ